MNWGLPTSVEIGGESYEIFGYDKVLERLERVIQQLVELQAAE